MQGQLPAAGGLLLLGRSVLPPLHHLLHHPHLPAHPRSGQASGARGQLAGLERGDRRDEHHGEAQPPAAQHPLPPRDHGGEVRENNVKL